MNTYEQHEIGKCYPPLPAAEFETLRQSIKEIGQLQPVVLFEGRILDGWCRALACADLDLEPKTIEPVIDDPFKYAAALNDRRRHLNEAQRAIVVGKLLAAIKNRKIGNNQFTQGGFTGATSSKLAEVHTIGKSTANFAARIITNGIPEVAEAVTDEKISLRAARFVTELPKEEQPAALQEAIEKKSSKNGSKKPRASRPPQNKPIIARPPKLRKLTPEESGYPVDGTFEEKDAHMARYGRVQTAPKVIFDLREADTVIGTYLMAIGNVIGDIHPKPEALFKYLKMLDAWVPQPEKGEDYATNFAAKAKRFSLLIDERLPIAVEQLTELLSLWQERQK